MENITRENEQITTPEQAAAELGIKLETLQKQYAMEKTLWYERTKIREEEAASIRAQLAEREQYARGELKQKEDAANALQRKIAELEAKLMLEQELSKAKIERKESDIKELQAKYDSQKEKYLQDINLVESKYSFKEEEARRLSGLIAQREVELGSQVQWKQQEALLQKSRFEEEIKKLSLELDAEKERRSKMSLEYNTGLSSMREQLSREVMELKIRHEEENRQHEKLSLRAREIETERMNFLSTINMLNMRVEELKAENSYFRQALYTPESAARLRYAVAQEETDKMAQKLAGLQRTLEEEKQRSQQLKQRMENDLIQKESELKELRKYPGTSREAEEKISKLQANADAIQAKLAQMPDSGASFEEMGRILREKEEAHSYFLDDIARGIVHKFRNLLGVINGAVEICSATMDDTAKKLEADNKKVPAVTDAFAEFKSNFDMAIDHINQMMKVVDEFRDISKPLGLDFQPLDVNGLLSSVSQAAAGRAQKQNVRIEPALDTSVPAIRADRQKMEFVFGEILTNALDALPKGGAVKISTGMAEGGFAVISFSDNGVGLPDTQVGKVFQPYFTNKVGRPGNGLTRVKRIIMEHNGSIDFKSEKGKGSTVTIKLAI